MRSSTPAAFAVCCALLVALAAAAKEADRINVVPGYGPPKSAQYSGYLEISPSKFIHYIYVAAESNQESAPLVLWLNGGPGCSSLDGWSYEQGPFRFAAGSSGAPTTGALVDNPGRWNLVANMLFIEAPVGVGFSYTTQANLPLNDTQTAQDNMAALLKFVEEFPEFVGRDLFLMGESYAGVYIPTLAEAILEAQAAGGASSLNLKGIAVGNGCIGNEVGACSAAGNSIRGNFLYDHDLFSPETYHNITAHGCFDEAPTDPACPGLLKEMGEQVSAINIYGVYSPCISGGLESGAGKLHSALADPLGLFGGPLECIDGIQAAKYFNTAEVKAAFHVDQDITWTICANLDYTPNTKNLPRDTYPTLIENMRVLIYSGNVDACVPNTGTFEWTAAMGYPVKKPWNAWFVNDQLAGYTVEYDVPTQFEFRSVNGAGHPVPQYAPAQALQMVVDFINDASNAE